MKFCPTITSLHDKRTVRRRSSTLPFIIPSTSMVTHFIIIFMLSLLHASPATTTQHTDEQLQAYSETLRSFRYDLKDDNTRLAKKLFFSLWRGLVKYKATKKEDSGSYGFQYLRDNQASVLYGLMINEIVPEGAPFTIDNISNTAASLSPAHLEFCWEVLQTFSCVLNDFTSYLQKKEGLMVDISGIDTIKGEYEDKVLANTYAAIFGRPYSPDASEASDLTFANMRMAAERAILKVVDYSQRPDVFLVTSFTQVDVSMARRNMWQCTSISCTAADFMELPEASSGAPSTPQLVSAVNYHALIARKLDLLTSAIARFLHQRKIAPSGSWEQFTIRMLENAVSVLEREKIECFRTAEEYRMSLARMWETLLPKDVSTYIQELESKDSDTIKDDYVGNMAVNTLTDALGAINVFNKFPELAIFLQLPPEDVPQEYWRLAGKVLAFVVHLEFPVLLPQSSQTWYQVLMELFSVYENVASAIGAGVLPDLEEMDNRKGEECCHDMGNTQIRGSTHLGKSSVAESSMNSRNVASLKSRRKGKYLQ
ncbi:hypothetical protein SeMB42_g05450 [Synchytrium endobioticum]|uniref:Uncharacterized protein n=1 Tax=Synchytrium endobioticum TaxID=286115 RepID=A0A507CRD2_9FUNG|nr:hypothetical protein SeMB42_g05450 [Synchytrium endobioticum]